MRLLFALVVWINLPHGILETNTPHPNGLARWIDFSWLGVEDLYPTLRLIAIPALLLYVWGRPLPMLLALGYLCFLHISCYTLYNSQGSIGHSYQIVGLVLLGQLLYCLYFLLKKKDQSSSSSWGAGWLYITKLIIVGTYVVSGITKLENSGGRWIQKSPYIGIDMIKTDRQNYYCYLDPKFGGEVPLAQSMLSNPTLTSSILAIGLGLELFAFLALHGRWASLLVGLGLVGMHRGIDHFMGLKFLENEWLLLIFLVNLPWWLWLGRKKE